VLCLSQPVQYRVVGRSGATIRAGENLDSPVLCTLSPGTTVDVDLVKGRRCRIIEPVKGWGSTSTDTGYVIIEAIDNTARPRYEVVHAQGVLVRSSSDPDSSDPVRLISQGEVVEGTGDNVLVAGVERVQLDDGWVSLTQPPQKDGTPGEALLRRIN
jgi:hypothetical protein